MESDLPSFTSGLPTLTEERSHPNHWYNRAADLRAAAGSAWYAMQNDSAAASSLGLPTGYSMGVACWPVYHMLCGLALEVLFKAVMAQRNMKIPEIHDLNNLASMLSLKRSEEERGLLKYYTSSVVWAGRYPIPRNCSDERLKNFYRESADVLMKPVKKLGSLVLRTSSGATDWENFHALWKRIANEFVFQ